MEQPYTTNLNDVFERSKEAKIIRAKSSDIETGRDGEEMWQQYALGLPSAAATQRGHY